MRRLTVVGLAAAALLLPPASAADADPEIELLVAEIFEGRPDEPFVSVVVRDAARRNYLAFHISTYLDVRELRVYLIPFRNADRERVDGALAEGAHEEAYQSLIAGMSIAHGARYVSDVALDGIRDAAVPLGSGSLRDNFHRQQYDSHDAADAAYQEWLRRAVELVERAR